MTLSVHIDCELLQEIDRAAKKSGKSRSALVQQALREWIGEQRTRWPAKVIAFKGIREAPRFESKRKELKPPPEPIRDYSRPEACSRY